MLGQERSIESQMFDDEIEVVVADDSSDDDTLSIVRAWGERVGFDVRVLPPGLQRQVAKVTVSSANLVTLRIGHTDVVWGGIDQPERKLAIMTALLKGRPMVIDVSAPDTPVTR